LTLEINNNYYIDNNIFLLVNLNIANFLAFKEYNLINNKLL